MLLLQFLLINMFPLVLLILPLFVLMRQLGLLDTHFALIVANSTIAIPFSVWMMTSYINGIPKSLDEAAMTDGCSRLQAMRKVILPLCAPGIIATGIYIFITAWIGISLPKLASRALERPEPTDILMRAMFNNRIPGPALPDIFDRQVVNTTQAPVPSLRDMAETCFRRDEAEEIIAEKRELFEYIRDRVGLDFLDGEKRENEMPDEAELLRRMIDYLVEISLDQAVRLKRLERLVNELRTAKGGA